MKYVIYDNLLNWAIFFGKDNIKLIDKKYNIKLYYFEYKDIQIWIPQLVNTSNIPINIDLEQTILKHYPELSECKRIITLNNMNLELSNSYIEKYKKDSVLVHLQLQGDAAQSIFNDENVKTITSTYFNSDAGKKYIHSDLKLCIPFFYYKHLLSLVNFNYIDSNSNNNPIDKIFIYARRTDESVSTMRDRAYFLNSLRNSIGNDKIEFGEIFRYEIEGERISFGAYHLGNYFDYNQCMFNIVLESIYVDSPKSSNNYVTEKSVFAILFSNPFFLLANESILKMYKDMGIVFLNDEFETNDIGDKFKMFCDFITTSTYKQRFELYKKYKIIQKQNREIILKYIRNPKLDCLEFLLN
jgi:hypothetical protein